MTTPVNDLTEISAIAGTELMACEDSTNLAKSITTATLKNRIAKLSDFGCVGDGSTDETTKIATAFSDPNHDILIIDGPGKTYMSMGDIRMRSGVIYIYEAWIKMIATTIETKLMVGHYGNTMINPLLDGNGQNQAPGETQGIKYVFAVYGSETWNVQDLRVWGGQMINGTHNIVQGGRDNVMFFGTKFEWAGEHLMYLNGGDSGGGGVSNCHGMSFVNCQFNKPCQSAEPHPEGHFVQVRTAFDVLFSGCTGVGENPQLPSFAFNITDVKGLRIENCTFHNITHTGIALDSDCDNVTIENCYFGGVTNTNFNSVKNNGGTNVVVSDCVFDESTQRQPGPDRWVNCEWRACITQHDMTDMHNVFVGCKFNFTAAYQKYMDVSLGSIHMTDCTFTGIPATSIALVFDTTGDVYLNGIYLPELTSGTNIDLRQAGNKVLLNAFLPLATSGSAIRTASDTTGKVMISNCFVPSGGILTSNMPAGAVLVENGNLTSSTAPI